MSAVAHGDRLVDGRALLFARDADTGEVVGALNGSGFRSLAVANETLYVASQDGCVYGVGTERSSNASRIRMSPDRSGSSSDDDTEPDDGNETHDTDANDTGENTTRPPNESNESTDQAPSPGLPVVAAILGLSRWCLPDPGREQAADAVRRCDARSCRRQGPFK
jgi:hypothetical protein